MIYKVYGNTGTEVSAVGFGGMRFDMEKSLEENSELLLYAHDKGINYFDTAPGYCQDKSEVIFGLGLKQLVQQRKRFCVATKQFPEVADTSAKAVDSVKKSLERLQVDKIDFYHVWCIREMAHYHHAMRPGGQYEGLLKCKEEGLIDHICISMHLRGPEIEEVMSKGEFDGVLLGVNILNFPYRWQAVQAAYDKGCGVVAMNPLSGGLIAQHAERFGHFCEAGQTPVEAALAFTIGCPQIAVTLNGFTTKEHIDTACKVAESAVPLGNDDIEAMRKKVGKGLTDLCTGCGYCMADCPASIPIAAYMQFYNQTKFEQVSDEQMAKNLGMNEKYGILGEPHPGATECVECRVCEGKCTQHLDIVERLREIATWEDLLAQQRAESQES